MRNLTYILAAIVSTVSMTRPVHAGPLGSLAVHLEYERFNLGGENPRQADLGLIWTFF
jgi:hypothetical protein